MGTCCHIWSEPDCLQSSGVSWSVFVSTNYTLSESSESRHLFWDPYITATAVDRIDSDL